MVVVSKDDTQADDVAPRNVLIPCAKVVAQRVCGLADNLQRTLDCQLSQTVFGPYVPSVYDVQDLVGRVEDILHPSGRHCGSQVDGLVEDMPVAVLETCTGHHVNRAP